MLCTYHNVWLSYLSPVNIIIVDVTQEFQGAEIQECEAGAELKNEDRAVCIDTNLPTLLRKRFNRRKK